LSDAARPSLVIFAAGKGTRLRPLTDRLPKAMIPVLDVPLIDLALRRAKSVEWAARLVNVSGPEPQLRDHLHVRQPDVEIIDEGDEPLGTAATVRSLLPRLSDTVLTYNCDLVSNLPLVDLLEAHTASGKGCTLTVRAVDAGADIAIEGGRMRLIDRRREPRGGLLYLGAGCFDRRVLETIPVTRPLGLTEGLLRRAVDEQEVALFTHDGYADDAGTLESYLKVSLEALERPELGIDPPGETSTQGGYLGPGAVAEDSSLGPGAIVLAGSRVLRGARLGECVVWPGSAVPADSILHRGIWFGERWLAVGH
jgi:mannose-1-phosphate guanylyltransferase